MLFYVSRIFALLESADQSHLSAENRYLKKVIIGGGTGAGESELVRMWKTFLLIAVRAQSWKE